MQTENDVVRTRARQDVDLLLGKNTDNSSSKSKKTKSKDVAAKKPPSELSAVVGADKKALPGIRGKVREGQALRAD